MSFTLFSGKPVLVPDIKYLVKFANGDLGISEQLKMPVLRSNISKISSPEALEIFSKSAGFNLEKPASEYFKDGKCRIKESDIKLDPSKDLSGLKALEKSLIQSIFESQKPYTEIFIQMVGVLIAAEDVIAAILTGKKPKGNSSALGFKGNTINKELSKVRSIQSKTPKIKGGTQSGSSTLDSDTSNITGIRYEILSTDYSTGTFNPNINYNYQYIDIQDDSIKESDLDTNGIDLTIPDDDVNKPRVVVFGIFDKKGNPLQDAPKWLQESGKWFGQFDMISDFKYVWTNPIFGDAVSFSSPGSGWRLKVGNNGPIIKYDKTDDINFFAKYIEDQIKTELDKTDLSEKDKSDILGEVKGKIDPKLQSDAIIAGGFLPTVSIKKITNPPIKRLPFKPKKVKWKNENIWIDPESDYDLKIIKVKPTFKVKYYDPNTKSFREATILPNVFQKKLKENQIRVIGNGKTYNLSNVYDVSTVININQIKNTNLITNNPYSDGYYGHSTDTIKQDITDVYRYATSLDEEEYYIIEGILESDNDQAIPTGGSSNNRSTLRGGGGSYTPPRNIIKAILNFIKFIVKIFAKLVPSINKLINLLSNPTNFLTKEVILKKLGDNNGTEGIKFNMFSKKFMDDYQKLSSIRAEERSNFVKNSELSNYVHVDDQNRYRFLLEGSSLISLFGFTFGIGTNNLNPKLTFTLKNISNQKNPLDSFLNLSNRDKEKEVKSSRLSNLNLIPKLDTSSNQIKTSAGSQNVTEEVSIQYSTGEFIEGVDYEYIYLTEEVERLIIDAEKLENTDDDESQKEAISKYEQALKIDTNNKLIKDKLENLKNKTKFNTQPILDFLLNLVSFPLKIVKSIVDYILNFFKSLSNPFQLPSKIPEFVSFKWILDFFTPKFMLDAIGIKFDVAKFSTWISTIDTYPDDHLFDLDQVISMPFMPKLFKANKSQLEYLRKSPLNMLSSILGLLEAIINSFVDFIWKLMGLSPILKAPHIRLTKNMNDPSKMTAKDIQDLLNGKYMDALSSDLVGSELNGGEVLDGPSYDFIYEITLPDGRKLRELDIDELNTWIEENKDYQFEFDF